MSEGSSVLLDSLLRPKLSEDALIALRRRGHAQLQQLGLPVARDEAWRYTSLRTLASKAFVLRDEDAATRVVPDAIQARIAAATLRLVFVNGELRHNLSSLGDLPSGLSIEPFVPTAHDVGPLSTMDAFVAANVALALSGASIKVAADTQVATPLHLFFVSLPSVAPVAFHSRVRVELERAAQCVLIEEHYAAGNAAHLCNRLLDIELDSAARLTHTRHSNASATMSSIHSSRYRLGRGAEVDAFELTSGQALNRHQVEVELIGDGARFVSGGVQALSGRAHSDVQINVHHRALDTSCDLIWRGIADQRARLGLTGNLNVDVGADGSDAKLSSKNLLLCAHAEINTRPVLVIHADAVKAAHGATVGRLDEGALFYLSSRGIPRARARVMLTHAFAIEALQALGDATLRAQMSAVLREAMSAFVAEEVDER
ncbi:MAG: SufD family Fe-S cluster assembly protein [Pseudomonadota bacterium]|nr:SufD family Fe-S cluster assembly protein [Pseudomonadota bacterium]